MSHFAKIDNNNTVTEVIVAEQDFINSGAVGDSFRWVQTSYNNNFRKHFAGIFVAPKPYPSWVLNASHDWEPPVVEPDDKEYKWNEATTNWVEV